MCLHGNRQWLVYLPHSFNRQCILFPEAHLHHLKFGSLNNKSLPQQMHFLEWHARGDFSAAGEHSGKLQSIKLPPSHPPRLSYTNTSILLCRKPENQHFKNGLKRANFISHSTSPLVSFLTLAKLVNAAQRTGNQKI